MKRRNSHGASVTSELIFDVVFIPEKNLLPKSKGLKSPLSCLSQACYGIAAEHQALRHICNLESGYIYKGKHDIHTLIVGGDITGIPAFR